MNNKIILMTALFSTVFFSATIRAHDDAEHKEETIDVTVNNDNGTIIKKVIMNGKELSVDEIKELEASGKLKTLHMNKSGQNTSQMKKMMIIEIDEDATDGKQVKIIKKLGNHAEMKKHWVASDSDGYSSEITIIKNDEGKEKITVDGKELSEDEVKEFKASNKFKKLEMDLGKYSEGTDKMIIVDTDDASTSLHKFKVFKSHNDEEGKFTFKNKFIISDDEDDPDRGRLGFMANVKEDGWHVTKVVKESGAQDAGIQKDDIIIQLGTNDLTKNDSSDKSMKMDTYKIGDKVKVKLKRDNDVINVVVDVKPLKSERAVDGDFNYSDFDSSIVFINKEGDFQLDEDDINIHFPESLNGLNVFISDGKSTSKLLGKRHKFSSISEDLSKYFGTKDGVLVLSVDSENVFGLKDGDVIKKVNDNEVSSPKSIIKELLKAEEQDKITLKIVRHKKNKTLKSK